MEQRTGPPVGPKMTIAVTVEGVGDLVRLDLDADAVACIAPQDQSDFGRFVARDDSGRLWSVAGFEMILRSTGRPVVVVDAYGAAPALWGRITDDPSPLHLDAENVDAFTDRLTAAERDDVERLKRAPGATAPLRRTLAIVDRLAPAPPAPPPRAVVDAAEAAALGVIATGLGLGGVPQAPDALDAMIAAGAAVPRPPSLFEPIRADGPGVPELRVVPGAHVVAVVEAARDVAQARGGPVVVVFNTRRVTVSPDSVVAHVVNLLAPEQRQR